jgi:hypothetical protein
MQMGGTVTGHPFRDVQELGKKDLGNGIIRRTSASTRCPYGRACTWGPHWEPVRKTWRTPCSPAPGPAGSCNDSEQRFDMSALKMYTLFNINIWVCIQTTKYNMFTFKQICYFVVICIFCSFIYANKTISFDELNYPLEIKEGEIKASKVWIHTYTYIHTFT